MEKQEFLNHLYQVLPTLSSTNQKIARIIFENPAMVGQATIQQLCRISKLKKQDWKEFCNSQNLDFAQLQKLLAPKEISSEIFSDSELKQIKDVLAHVARPSLINVRKTLQSSTAIQVLGKDSDYFVEQFNQVGIFSYKASNDSKVALSQLKNMPQNSSLVIIGSDSSESLIRCLRLANSYKVKTIVFTQDDELALNADYSLKTSDFKALINALIWIIREDKKV